MTVESLPCGNPECEYSVAPDSDHVKVKAERVNMKDRNREEAYYFHPECFDEVATEWVTP